jgi:hypothetical protein
MAKSMQLFLAARLFPSHFANDGYICNKCRVLYIKWKALPQFNDILTMIDDSHQTTNATMDINNEDSSDDDCMDAENSSNQSVNETASDKESMNDDDPDDGQTLNESSSDNQSVDATSSDDYMKGEEMSSDENSEAVSYLRYPL